MKRTVRKWLSLLMAFAIVLSLMPVALAADENTQDPPGTTEGTNPPGTPKPDDDDDKTEEPGGNEGDNKCEDGKHNYEEKTDHGDTKAATCTEKGVKVEVCSKCSDVKKTDTPALGHDWGEYFADKNDSSKHTRTCKRDACEESETNAHDYSESYECVCGTENDAEATGAEAANVTISAGASKEISWHFYTGSGSNKEYTKAPDYVLVSDDDCVSIYRDGVTVYGEYSGKATISIYDGSVSSRNLLGTTTVTVKGSSGYNIKVSVSADSNGYALGDDDDAGKDSVIDQINSQLRSREYIDYIWFQSVKHDDGELTATRGNAGNKATRYTENEAGSVEFIPDKNAKKGDSPNFEVAVQTDSRDEYIYFTITFNIIDGATSGGDVEYNATAGKNVTFDSDDFETFWKNNRRSSWKDLDYVTFSTPTSSTGVLYDGDGTKLKNSTECYVSAGRNQVDLDDVYFEPKSSKAGTVRINFTAVGESDHEIDGTVVISYLNGDIDDITYTTNSSGKVDLKAKDFTDVFKAATGSSSSSLTITFTSLPSNGTLTYGSKDTKVTKSTTFKTSGAGNKIADVTYTASGSKSDTVTYTAASGSTKITGKILFNSVAANISLTVPYTCTSASGITFSTGDFTSRASGLTGSHSLAFGQPSGGNGGLYYTAIASQIPAGTKIPVSTLNTVTYRPSSNGATTIAFIIYDASGLVAGSGSVTITVSGVTGGTANPGNPGNPGTTTPGGVDSFKDVNATAWYRTDLTRLVSLGIMAGRSPNKFAPEGTLNYGEALKLICKAVGVTQPEGSGAQWAANYKSYAVSQGWITSDVVLTDTITRTAIAQIGAKALGLSASSATPFPDTNDPYVAAMNTAGIILGNPDGNFNGSGNLKRSEICAIICRMLNYRDNAYNDQIPGWL